MTNNEHYKIVIVGGGAAGRQGADPALVQVVWRELERHVVAGNDADVALAHLAAAVGHQLVTVVERDAVACIGQGLVDHAVHFEKFFFGHALRPFRGGWCA